MTTALILIDIQNDYFPGGRMELEGSREAAGRAGDLLQFFRTRGLPVLHVQHLSTRPDATFLISGTEGTEIHPLVSPLPGEPVIVKHFPNSFRETELLSLLGRQRIERLVIGGMMTHMCVDATVRAAFDNGFACTVAADACATRTLSFGGTDIPSLQVQGAFLATLGAVYARVATVGEIVRDVE